VALDHLNQTALFYASREGKSSLVDLLVTLGCPTNHVDSYGQTAIFYGAREGHVEVCRRLVSHGANPD
jgi:ankyrin repeat protein